jgi:hypothetical protein
MSNEKAVAAGFLGFFLLILAVHVIQHAFDPSILNIPKSIGTAICFIIGFVPPYAYVRYKNRR